MARDVKQVPEDMHDEALRLRTALRDLVAISAIPAAWVGREAHAIAAEFADILVHTLRLDFVFVRLLGPTDNAVTDVTRGNGWLGFSEWLQRRVAEGGGFPPREIVSDVDGDKDRGRGIVIPIGANSKGGLIAAACYRAGFPGDIDQLLLSIAANHAATAFQNACLIAERRRAEKALQQARDELEMKVAERTAELRRMLKVSQAISGEIVQDKLLDTLMRTAMEQAGAQRGLLLLASEAEPTIKAEATITDDAVVVQVRDEPVTTAMLSESMLHYVMRTRECVILDDAVNEGSFSSDRYIRQHGVRSVLYLPLTNQGELIGVLYLENNLTPGVFAPARIAVLTFLASQAAVTLKNARLYRDLGEREARIRRLVDANIVGIFIWNIEGQILEANDEFLRIVGYDRDALLSGRLRWTDLTPRDWLDLDEQKWVPLIKLSGVLQPFEKEYLRKDGSRVPVLIGAATFKESGQQCVAFVLDLTERKRAEAEARDSERRYREVQMSLAHAHRVTTMGQLAASISHEIRQPIGATAANAQAGLRWLCAQPPHLEEAREAFDRIVKDAMRASEVTNRIRGLVKNAPSSRERLQINEVIGEVVALTHDQIRKSSVSLRMELAEDLPLVDGDCIQLQQVLLNLIMNALEAMSAVDGGSRELVISTGKDAMGGVMVAVRDSGPGVADESVERVFEPFYTTKASGMGMGLSICRSMVESHGGRLLVSANVPRGAVFQFTLPGPQPHRNERHGAMDAIRHNPPPR